MKKKTAIIITISIVVLLSLVMGVMYIFGYGIFEPEDNDIDTDIKIVTENYKTEIVVYGNEIKFDEACYVRNIDEISKSNLVSDDSFVYTVFVINDLDGALELTDKDLDVIKSKVIDEKIDFFYFGKKNYKNIVDAGIFSQDLLDSEMSLGVIYERGIRTEVIGTWTEEANKYYKESNPDLLGENILSEIVSKIRFDNK